MIKNLLCFLCFIPLLISAQADFSVKVVICPMGMNCDNEFQQIEFDYHNNEFIVGASPDDPGALVTMNNKQIKVMDMHGLDIANDLIKQIVTAPDTSVLVSVANKGLFKFKFGEVEEVKLPYGDQFGQFIADLEFDHLDFMWVGHDWGFGLFALDGAGTVYDYGVSNYIQDLHQDNDQTMWIATRSDLYYVNDFEQRKKNLFNADFLSDGYVYKIASDDVGNLWMAIKNDVQPLGLVKYDGTNGTVYTSDNSNLHSNQITDMVKGSDGEFYIATYDKDNEVQGGLLRFNPNTNQLEDFNSLHANLATINDLIYHEGELYAATDQGISIVTNDAMGVPVKVYQEEQFEIWPNPFVHSVNVTVPQEIELVKVYNALGSLILEQKVNTREVLQINGAAGMYQIQFIDSDLNAYTHKLIKR